jgi:hypothetical protein
MKLKLALSALLVLTTLSFGSALAAEKLWRGSIMNAESAAKRWGSAEFDSAKFKSGDVKIRATMAAALQKQLLKKEGQFIGKTATEVRDLLGPFSGFYQTDAYPTYLIEVGKSHAEETWQVVFLLDRDRRVKSMMIHKNCCEP